METHTDSHGMTDCAVVGLQLYLLQQRSMIQLPVLQTVNMEFSSHTWNLHAFHPP